MTNKFYAWKNLKGVIINTNNVEWSSTSYWIKWKNAFIFVFFTILVLILYIKQKFENRNGNVKAAFVIYINVNYSYQPLYLEWQNAKCYNWFCHILVLIIERYHTTMKRLLANLDLAYQVNETKIDPHLPNNCFGFSKSNS